MKSVLRDETGLAYPTPHWKDNSIPADNDNADVGDHNFPVVYPSGTGMDLSATLSVFPPLPLEDTFTVTATGTRNGVTYTFSAPATNTGSSLTISNVLADNLLPTHVDYFNPLWLSWSVTQTNGENPMNCSISGTGHRIYVTLGPPNAGSLYETVIHQGCTNAKDLTDSNSVIAAIWSEFTDRMVKRKSKDGYNNTDGTQLTYYQNWNCINTSTQALLANSDGQCGSWAKFFIDIMGGQGINHTNEYILFQHMDATGLQDFGIGFIVKNWTFSSSGGTSGLIDDPYLNIPNSPLTGQQSYNWTYTEVDDVIGLPGQGTPNPASLFSNHQVVKLGTQYYDPSYGAMYTSLADIDNLAIDGYWKNLIMDIDESVIVEDLNNDGDMVDVFLNVSVKVFQVNQAGNQLKEVPFEYPPN